MSAGIKNWHWRTKGVEPWAKTWFTDNLTGVTTNGVTISEVTDVEGDCEIGMRKSKLVTIYDEKITMKWKAEGADGESVTGSIVAIEVSHDMDEDEYVFTSTLDATTSKDGDRFQKLAKGALANKLRSIFQSFPQALIETHGKDLLADTGDSTSTPGSGVATPTLKSVATTAVVSDLGGLTFNTSSVKVEAEFQVSSEDLFDFLTNEAKIPKWSRNSAVFKPEVGSNVSLFGGNIVGEVTSVSRPTSLIQSWRAPTFPDGHFGELDMSLTQGSNSTTLVLRLSGVPLGKEDELERALNGYYINGLRSIGLVIDRPSLPSTTTSSISTPPPATKKNELPPPGRIGLILTTAIPMTISVSLIVGLIAAFYYGPSGPGAH